MRLDNVPAFSEQCFSFFKFYFFRLIPFPQSNYIIASMPGSVPDSRRRIVFFLPCSDKRGTSLLFFGANARIVL